MVDEIGKWRAMSIELEKQLGRPANTEEIAKALKLPARRAAIIQDALTAVNMGHQQLMVEDKNVDILDTVVDERTTDENENLFDERELQVVKELLGQLDEREARILKLRYGLEEDGRSMTLKEVGEAVKLTRERVRQLEHLALAKLEEYIGARLGHANTQ
jgi:RNA polymerase primary sigma factor